jgi:putative hydrolase
MLCVDFHTHSIASIHALNTVEELLRRADRLGLEGIAITDHGPGTDNTIQIAKNLEADYRWSHLIKGPDVHYFNVLVSRYLPPEEIKITLFKGIECNILGQGKTVTDLPKSLMAKFDVVIASVHPIPHVFEIKDQAHFTERLLLAMDQPIDIVGHPFHKLFAGDQELIVRTAAEKSIALELNNSSLRLKKADESTILAMLKLARHYDCRISLSSDSHAANELGSDESIRPLLTECDFPPELIVNHSLAAAKRFVEERKRIRAEIQARVAKHDPTLFANGDLM